MDEQAPLLELPEQPEKIVPRGAEPATPAAPRFAELDRTQLRWVELDLENLVGADHLARAIWDLVGKLDLTAFEAGYASREGRAGRPGWPPRALISIWIYAYSQGIASARAVERMMAWEPGLRWLAADQVISHHTLSDFRVSEQERLAKLFEDVLGVMQSEELLDLSTILQDGTKVRARASKGSLHRRQRLEEHCAEARAVVAELERQGEQEAVDVRRQAARKRAAQDRVERMKAALEELTEREREAGPARRKELRVSESEPEARKMKHADGSWAPSYNVQVQTEARSRMVVGIEVTQAANDAEQLVGGLEQVEQNTGVKPERMIADGGYVSRENVEALSERAVELIAPWKEAGSRSSGACTRQGIAEEFWPGVFTHDPTNNALRCPRGQILSLVQIRKHHGVECEMYEARVADCAACEQKPRCCPGDKAHGRRVERVKESAAMQAFQQRMKSAEGQQWYGRRSEVAEFPHLWWKGVWKWRQFSVRGLARAAKEALWIAITYNIQQWVRLRWAQQLSMS